MNRLFTCINEPRADFKWQALFNERWPAYSSWLQTSSAATDLKVAVAALVKYMPEIVETYEGLCRLVRADETARCFLTGFQPPRYNNACSQAVSTIDKLVMVRNYDYHPGRFEGVLLSTAWNGKKVMANSDCLMGVLDGMNEDGLAVSLTFGGRKTMGYGFGIPFILRYILEFCSSVEQAVEALIRIPSHMAYNITITDKTNVIKTVQIAPDHPALVTEAAFTTNHQNTMDSNHSPSYHETVERASFLEDLILNEPDDNDFIQSFLRPPLHNNRYTQGFGTLYTAVYRPKEGSMKLLWPKEKITQSFDNFMEVKKLITYN